MIRALFIWLAAAFTAGAAMEQASKPSVLTPEEAAKAGRELAAKILSERPAQNFTNTGVIKVQAGKTRTEIPVQFLVGQLNEGTWQALYRTTATSNNTHLLVVHEAGKANRYLHGGAPGDAPQLQGNETMTPFAGSDFWVADLGLEFLHWPEQHLLRKEIRRGQACNVLESVNPQPAPGAYSRVLSWIDIDTDGIINAEAFDAKGKPLKDFAAKSFKKVRGEWELQEIQMENRQTGSRTSIEFNLSSK